MRYDNMFWVLIAPALASCACFAFEMCCTPSGSWNDRFEELRRGFEMLGGKGKGRNHTAFPEVPVTHNVETRVLVAAHKRMP